jgi:hypothetical protein
MECVQATWTTRKQHAAWPSQGMTQAYKTQKFSSSSEAPVEMALEF